jgi:hypothetical protein
MVLAGHGRKHLLGKQIYPLHVAKQDKSKKRPLHFHPLHRALVDVGRHEMN